MEKLAGPLVGVAFIALIGMGTYLYMVRGELTKAQAAVATAQKDRDGYKQKLDDVTKKGATDAASLQSCVTQLNDVQARLDANLKPLTRRPRPPAGDQ